MIYKNKITGILYYLIKAVDDENSTYLNLEDKYEYTIPDCDMEYWIDLDDFISYC